MAMLNNQRVNIMHSHQKQKLEKEFRTSLVESYFSIFVEVAILFLQVDHGLYLTGGYLWGGVLRFTRGDAMLLWII